MLYVALLRGINVGGNNKVSMKALKSTFESCGFKNVLTYINSGNIIFEDKNRNKIKIVQKIERKIKKDFALDVKVLLRDAKNIIEVSKKIPKPWTNDTHQRTDILFLWNTFNTPGTVYLIKKTRGIDNIKYISGAIVWNVQRKDLAKSSMKKFIGTVVYKHMTARNANTVRKLSEILKKI